MAKIFMAFLNFLCAKHGDSFLFFCFLRQATPIKNERAEAAKKPKRNSDLYEREVGGSEEKEESKGGKMACKKIDWPFPLSNGAMMALPQIGLPASRHLLLVYKYGIFFVLL